MWWAHPSPTGRLWRCDCEVAGGRDVSPTSSRRATGRTPPPGDDSSHVELSDAPGQLRDAAEDAAQARNDDSRLSATYTMPWGEECSGAAPVDMCVAELATHAGDRLAAFTGRDPRAPLDR